ncbi:sensor histidine kinase [Paenibacillus chondroitinus]|uniref:Sensor histidine kinase n=1 Tax=Paenibacillus chondroitinus TaxID=59842 RepID=A0ABU6D841_9BACL|nr:MULTISPECIES: sensor histidine kinase [Paenibacillus]MCY9661803.1 sensor histidine kinase [Paenibacillus anseongense]MEB4793888.1 sensor histidine kinase [Paenibacillus chondroitinus]
MILNRYPFLHFSLRTKSIAIFILLVTLPSLLIGNVILSRYDAVLRQQYIDAMEKNLNTIELNLSEKIKAIEDLSNYMIYQENFRRFMETPTTPGNMEQMNKDQTTIEGFIAFQIMSKVYIKSISLEGVGGNQLQMGEPVKGLEQSWTDLAKERRGGVIWTDSYQLESGWTGNKRVVSMVRVINSFDNTSHPVGEVIVRLDESEITDLLMSAVPQDQGSIFIVRPEGNVVLHQNQNLVGHPYPSDTLLSQFHGGLSKKVSSLKEDGASYVVFSQPMKSTGWYIVAMVKDQTIVQKTEAIKASLKFLILIILIFGLIALIGFEFAMIRPMLELSKQTSKLKKGDFSAQVKVRSRDEVGELGRQFNNMVMTIKELIDKKYKLEIRQKESELRILQSQMDPHFLYNTLDMIRWTARLEKATETSQLIETLSLFFRMGQNSGKRYTTLPEELDFVHAYLDLQQKRMGSKLQFTLHMDEELNHAVLLKKIIQPLVENSIKHGFKRGGGRIEVRCYKAEQDVLIDVVDSGVGFVKNKLEVIRQVLQDRSGDEGIMNHAICNIHERITLEYGEGYGIELPSEPPFTGACVRIRLPFQMSAQEEKR